MSVNWMFYCYGVMAFFSAVYLTIRNRPRRVFLSFIIVSWILGGSIIHQDIFNLPLKQLGGNLQIRQLFFIILVVYFFIASFSGFPRTGNRSLYSFEKYYLFFAGAFFTVCIYHIANGTLSIREFRGLAEGTIMALLIYLLLRRYADCGLVEAIVGAIILVGVVTAIVSIIQYLIAPDFLRVGFGYVAFGEQFRSKGIFDTEYLNSFYLLVAAITVLFWVSKKSIRIVLLSLYSAGICLTFHRMSWIAAMITLILYVMLTGKMRSRKPIIAGVFAVTLIVVIAAAVDPSITDPLSESTLYRTRLSSNTVTDRLKIYEMVENNFSRIALWGAGSTKNSLYYHGMLGTGVADEKWAIGQRGSIHNGYLEILFLYGLPVLFLYGLVLLKSAWECYKIAIKEYSMYFLPFFVLTVFLCMNFTNSLPWYSYYGSLSAFILGISTKTSLIQYQSQNSTDRTARI